MKTIARNWIVLAGLILSVQSAFADNTESLNTLGNQEMLLDKAKPSVPSNTYRVVQKRIVDREHRFEFDLRGGGNAGGDSYYNSQNLGVQAEFHLTNRWSIGARQDFFVNTLTAEGQRRYNDAEASAAANNGVNSVSVPDLDWPVSKTVATISFYPLYGKMSWFESTVSYFDMYLLGGGGVMNLRKGSSPLATAGLGVGMWWTQHFTTRIEALYQNYRDNMIDGPRTIQDANINVSLGFLL